MRTHINSKSVNAVVFRPYCTFYRSMYCVDVFVSEFMLNHKCHWTLRNRRRSSVDTCIMPLPLQNVGSERPNLYRIKFFVRKCKNLPSRMLKSLRPQTTFIPQNSLEKEAHVDKLSNCQFHVSYFLCLFKANLLRYYVPFYIYLYAF